jgi:hypothetical protein
MDLSALDTLENAEKQCKGKQDKGKLFPGKKCRWRFGCGANLDGLTSLYRALYREMSEQYFRTQNHPTGGELSCSHVLYVRRCRCLSCLVVVFAFNERELRICSIAIEANFRNDNFCFFAPLHRELAPWGGQCRLNSPRRKWGR